MSSNVSKPRATYAEVVAAPDHLIAELIDGELVTSPRPALRHSLAGSTLHGELSLPFQQGRGGPGGWWILFEPELHLAADIIVPDLAGWRRSRLSAVPPDAFTALAPDWICEVLSPSTESIDRIRKLRVYAREGVNHAWLVNPTPRTLEVLRLEQGRWVQLAVHGGAETVRAEPFDAIPLNLSPLWGDPIP